MLGGGGLLLIVPPENGGDFITDVSLRPCSKGEIVSTTSIFGNRNRFMTSLLVTSLSKLSIDDVDEDSDEEDDEDKDVIGAIASIISS